MRGPKGMKGQCFTGRYETSAPSRCSAEGEQHRLIKGNQWWILGFPVTLTASRMSPEHPPAHGVLGAEAEMETTPFWRAVNS